MIEGNCFAPLNRLHVPAAAKTSLKTKSFAVFCEKTKSFAVFLRQCAPGSHGPGPKEGEEDCEGAGVKMIPERRGVVQGEQCCVAPGRACHRLLVSGSLFSGE